MQFAPTDPNHVTEDQFDLDIVVLPSRYPSRPGQVWNSGDNCHTDDNCGQTCESACAQSCTDGE